ncbi:MAG: hypothetical protein HQL67_08165 [Magnetococcales bacterium]|nr:hypothetical protein [Magnetococcales bacterium]
MNHPFVKTGKGWLFVFFSHDPGNVGGRHAADTTSVWSTAVFRISGGMFSSIQKKFSQFGPNLASILKGKRLYNSFTVNRSSAAESGFSVPNDTGVSVSPRIWLRCLINKF